MAADRRFPFKTNVQPDDGGGDRPISVSELTARIKQALETRFSPVVVEGEISNWRPGPSGHVYFALKDANAVLSCVLWRDTARRVRGGPDGAAFGEGALVEARGRISVYEPRGAYQLVVESMRAAGVGDLYRRFVELKARLEAEGLFAPERKRPVPVFPRRIGVVTSPRGAALRDILNVLRRRFPGLEVVLASARVQGAEAAKEIVRAINHLDALPPERAVDTIIVARGGGSLEDIWPFNEEAVARAIAASKQPVISGVGHETDFTLADFAADCRAPTPSAAAELAVTPLEEWRGRVRQAAARALRAMRAGVMQRRSHLRGLLAHPGFEEPRARVNRQRQRLDELRWKLGERGRDALEGRRKMLDRASNALAPAMRRAFTARQRAFDRATSHLDSLNPRGVLERGYAIVARQQGERVRILSDARRAPRGARLSIEFANGRIGAVSEGPQGEGFQLGLDLAGEAGAAEN